MIDLLDRLAPFTEPTLVVRDDTPRFSLAEDSASSLAAKVRDRNKEGVPDDGRP